MNHVDKKFEEYFSQNFFNFEKKLSYREKEFGIGVRKLKAKMTSLVPEQI